MKIKKIKYLMLPALALPMILTSCSTANRTNFVTTYDNALDDAITLGIAPDMNSSGNWTDYVATYIKDLGTKANVKFLDYRFFPKGTGSIDLKKIAETNSDVVVANITDSGFSQKIKNEVNKIAYTGRGDNASYSYTDEQINFVDENNADIGFDKATNPSSFKKIDNTEQSGVPYENKFFSEDYGYSYNLYNFQQNPFLALNNLAKSLDEYSNNKNNFVLRAQEVETMQKNRITALNNNTLVKEKINGKTVAFILGKKESSSSKDVATNFHLYNPHTYPQFYSRKDDKGLKMNFPIFNDIKDLNATHFADPDIIAGDSNSYHTFKNSTNGNKLIEMFKHKFDYVVYMTYDASNFKHTHDDVVKSDIKNLLKITKPTSTGKVENTATSEEQIKSHIFYTTYSDMYMPTWGPIGQSLTITNFIKYINNSIIKTGETKIEETDKTNILHENIDVKTLKRWRDLK